MGLLPRLYGGGGVYYVIFGCAVTVFFFLVVNNQSVVQLDYGNLSKRNYEYEEVCREWKVALGQEKAPTNASSLNSEDDIKLDDDGWDENFDLSSHFHCDNSNRDKTISKRGQYYVIYNFVKADKEFGCTESITLTAPGDYRFLDNVIPLIDHWRGPVSIALYTPGYDFFTTIRAIAYLRNCETYLIRKLVSFHLFFDQEHVPKHNGSPIIDCYVDSFDCTKPPPWENANDEDMYKSKKALLYPINVARNVAKLAATTYFVFPSDIELYPTRNFIPLFLRFATENLNLFKANQKNVFVLPVFEILEKEQVPENKTQLLTMLQKKKAIVFHQKVCAVCHTVIDGAKWIKTNETPGLGVFSVGKRVGRHMVWEPFFVCTQKEPLWDERMTWEGQNNKMVQAYEMCVMNYDFHVLDNAFLIHKPGVKKTKVQVEKFNDLVKKSDKVILTISIELQELYGYNSNCSTTYKNPPKPKPVDAKADPKKVTGKI